MSIEKCTVYECGGCGEYYRESYEAQRCCEPESRSGYSCDRCGYAWAENDKPTCECTVSQEMIGREPVEPLPGTLIGNEFACYCGHPERWHKGKGEQTGLCLEGSCDCRKFVGVPLALKVAS